MAGETGESVGLPPEASAVTKVETQKKNIFSRILDAITPHSQADALVGTTAGRVMPEATAAVASQVAKTEQPILPPQPAAVK